MEIILKQDVENLGYQNDVVKVKPGYAVNFLIPKGMAVPATKSNLKVHQENMRQQAHKAEKMVSEAKAAVEKLQSLQIKLGAKVGESGKIFGSINTVMLADALRANGIEIERKNIKVSDDNIRSVGTYQATAILFKDIKTEFTFEVVAE
jgi:large subunit ribosomal protein L9